MEEKRFIFDLDGTLLTSDFHLERSMFYNYFGEDARMLVTHMGEYLCEYESLYPYYDIDILSSYLRRKSKLPITQQVILDWICITGKDPGVIEDGVIELLEYLKANDCSIAVLTNWFYNGQVPRLRSSGILGYVDQVYGGDYFLKPSREAYLMAMGSFSEDDCVFVGDDFDKDYIGPRTCNIESVLYDKGDVRHDRVVKVKKMNEIIHRY